MTSRSQYPHPGSFDKLGALGSDAIVRDLTPSFRASKVCLRASQKHLHIIRAKQTLSHLQVHSRTFLCQNSTYLGIHAAWCRVALLIWRRCVLYMDSFLEDLEDTRPLILPSTLWSRSRYLFGTGNVLHVFGCILRLIGNSSKWTSIVYVMRFVHLIRSACPGGEVTTNTSKTGAVIDSNAAQEHDRRYLVDLFHTSGVRNAAINQ
ncbi:hypothetical protein BJV74DRAFT_272179 [Russula compacta]|nr:hypothetical protein BJV74DRAFT_272179 [Russula compacta]